MWLASLRSVYAASRGTFFHPQWLSDRCHFASRQLLAEICNARILDIGSGNSDNRSSLGPGNTLHRLDYPATNRRYNRLPDIFGDACRLPVVDASCDVVLLLEVLEHITDAETALLEIKRVLRCGGRLYLSVPFLYPLHDEPADYRRFTIHGLRQLLHQHGFSIETERQHGNSLLTSLQLFNLALLESIRNIGRHHAILALVLAIPAYSLTLISNMLAVPLLRLKSLNAACLGYFIVAAKD
jgi:SAM-dependent methyltransferase